MRRRSRTGRRAIRATRTRPDVPDEMCSSAGTVIQLRYRINRTLFDLSVCRPDLQFTVKTPTTTSELHSRLVEIANSFGYASPSTIKELFEQYVFVRLYKGTPVEILSTERLEGWLMTVGNDELMIARREVTVYVKITPRAKRVTTVKLDVRSNGREATLRVLETLFPQQKRCFAHDNYALCLRSERNIDEDEDDDWPSSNNVHSVLRTKGGKNWWCWFDEQYEHLYEIDERLWPHCWLRKRYCVEREDHGNNNHGYDFFCDLWECRQTLLTIQRWFSRDFKGFEQTTRNLLRYVVRSDEESTNGGGLPAAQRLDKRVGLAHLLTKLRLQVNRFVRADSWDVTKEARLFAKHLFDTRLSCFRLLAPVRAHDNDFVPIFTFKATLLFVPVKTTNDRDSSIKKKCGKQSYRVLDQCPLRFDNGETLTNDATTTVDLHGAWTYYETTTTHPIKSWTSSWKFRQQQQQQQQQRVETAATKGMCSYIACQPRHSEITVNRRSCVLLVRDVRGRAIRFSGVGIRDLISLFDTVTKTRSVGGKCSTLLDARSHKKPVLVSSLESVVDKPPETPPPLPAVTLPPPPLVSPPPLPPRKNILSVDDNEKPVVVVVSVTANDCQPDKPFVREPSWEKNNDDMQQLDDGKGYRCEQNDNDHPSRLVVTNEINERLLQHYKTLMRVNALLVSSVNEPLHLYPRLTRLMYEAGLLDQRAVPRRWHADLRQAGIGKRDAPTKTCMTPAIADRLFRTFDEIYSVLPRIMNQLLLLQRYDVHEELLLMIR